MSFSDPTHEAIASANVAYCTARQFAIMMVSWTTPNLAVRATSVALSGFDCYLTYQTAKALMSLRQNDGSSH